MPRGRVRILDEAKQREICALISAGCSLQAAAHYVECAPNTIRREAARNPEFGRRFREARLQAQLSPLQAMRKAAASHWRAAAWMLERADPEHFSQRPHPAFRPKQAQALRNDILTILSTEIEDPNLLQRVRRQIQHLMRYTIDGVVRVERTDRQLRSVLREIDQLEIEADMNEVLERLQSGAQLGRSQTDNCQHDNGKHGAGQPALDPTEVVPAEVPPTNAPPSSLPPTLVPSSSDLSPPLG